MRAVLFVALFIVTARAEIVLKNNGYEDIVVALHNNIEEDGTILENLKELFRSGSQALYKATRNRTFFRSVTIALPDHWSDKNEYIRSTGNHFTGANVRVDAPNPEYGDEPYTLQPGACGEPGKYIHLTTNYVRSLSNEKEYDKPAKRLVHEWAHLRYGVFDENADPKDTKYPSFYKHGRFMKPNACVGEIRGSMVRRDGSGTCEIIEANVDTENCLFEPFSDNTAEASLMFKPYVPSVVNFCNADDHNKVAPNKHNEMCNSDSVWAVMDRHADFQSSNTPVSLTPEELIPTFRILKAKKNDKGRFVLVLDISGSMKGIPLQLLHDSSSRLISEVVPEGSYLGMVAFHISAVTLSPLVQISNQTKEELLNRLPLKADGKTAIGKGLQLGVKVLQDQNNVTDGAVLVLLSDGEENIAPAMSDVVPDIIDKKVVVYCIAFGSKASQNLENLAQSTGGKSFLVEDVTGEKPITELDNAFRESVYSTVEEEKQPVKVMQNDVKLYTKRKTEEQLDLDPQLGLNTVFALDVAGQETNSVDMVIVSPQGEIFGPGSGTEIYSKGDNQIKISIPGQASPGPYKVELTNQNVKKDVSVSLSVASEPRDPDDPPVRVRSWLSDIQVQYPGRIRVYAEVTRNYNPVIGASVVSTVKFEKTLEEVVLLDDGNEPDATANDGIYSGFVTKFHGNGRYGVVTRVTNAGRAKLKFTPKTTEGARSRRRRVRSVPIQENVYEPSTLLPFQRTSESGTFLVIDWKPGVPNTFPPAKVRDLQTTGEKILPKERRIVTLAWTSPVRENDTGSIAQVELKAGCSREDLVKRYESSFQFRATSIVSGSLQAAEPHERQSITVRVPAVLVEDTNCISNGTESYYFALRIYESVNKTSDVSVITVAHFLHIKKSKEFQYEIIIAAVVALLILLAVIFVIVKMLKKRRKVAPAVVDNEMYYTK